MASIGRADETVEAKATEMFVGMIPLVGDGGAIIGEVVNAVDPDTEVSKINLLWPSWASRWTRSTSAR
jgi:hypothetical protein